MKHKDLESKSKEELIQLLNDFYSSPYINVYFSIKKQLDKLAHTIESATIDVDEKSFDSFIKWGEKSLIIADNVEGLLAKMDASILREETEKRLRAEEGTIESYINNG